MNRKSICARFIGNSNLGVLKPYMTRTYYLPVVGSNTKDIRIHVVLEYLYNTNTCRNRERIIIEINPSARAARVHVPACRRKFTKIYEIPRARAAWAPCAEKVSTSLIGNGRYSAIHSTKLVFEVCMQQPAWAYVVFLCLFWWIPIKLFLFVLYYNIFTGTLEYTSHRSNRGIHTSVHSCKK
jgi:hypothetical protein